MLKFNGIILIIFQEQKCTSASYSYEGSQGNHQLGCYDNVGFQPEAEVAVKTRFDLTTEQESKQRKNSADSIGKFSSVAFLSLRVDEVILVLLPAVYSNIFCSFLLYLHHIMLVNVKSDKSR